MEHFCSKCEIPHIRPVARHRYSSGMTTNIVSTQVTVAPNAFFTQQLNSGFTSPILSCHSGSSVNRSASKSTSTTTSANIHQGQLRTDELILAELQKLSTRMTQIEQELQAETFTSTPRKSKRMRAGMQGEDSSLFATVNRTDGYISLDDSAALCRQPETVRIPVRTHSNTSTTTSTVSSLFTHGGQRVKQHTTTNVNQLSHTETVFSACQNVHQGQHI